MILQILAVHTFVAALWRVGLEARGFALFLVGLVIIFVALWVGLGSGIHKHYEAPTPVRISTSPLSHLVLTRYRPHSIGAGSVPHSRANA